MRNILITLLFFPLVGGDLSESHKRSFDEMADISDILDHVGPLGEDVFNHDPDVLFNDLSGTGAEDAIFDPLNQDYWANRINQQPLNLGVVHTVAKEQKQRVKKPCPECGCSVHGLKEHMRTHTGEKPYKCKRPGCDYAATRLSNIRAHERTHTGERPYKCDYPGCGYAARCLSHIQDHARTHTGERPFKCNHPGCGYVSAHSSHIKVHERTHTGERPYKCNLLDCNFASVNSGNLQIHMRMHIKEKPFKCEHSECVYETSYKRDLERHIKTHDKILCLICKKMVSNLSKHSESEKHRKKVAVVAVTTVLNAKSEE